MIENEPFSIFRSENVVLDSAQADPEVFGPIYLDSTGNEVYATQTTTTSELTQSGSEGGYDAKTTKTSRFTNSVVPE